MPLSESVLGNRAFDTEEGGVEREGGGGRGWRERERERTQNFITQGLRFQAVFLTLQSERETGGGGR